MRLLSIVVLLISLAFLPTPVSAMKRAIKRLFGRGYYTRLGSESDYHTIGSAPAMSPANRAMARARKDAAKAKKGESRGDYYTRLDSESDYFPIGFVPPPPMSLEDQAMARARNDAAKAKKGGSRNDYNTRLDSESYYLPIGSAPPPMSLEDAAMARAREEAENAEQAEKAAIAEMVEKAEKQRRLTAEIDALLGIALVPRKLFAWTTPAMIYRSNETEQWYPPKSVNWWLVTSHPECTMYFMHDHSESDMVMRLRESCLNHDPSRAVLPYRAPADPRISARWKDFRDGFVTLTCYKYGSKEKEFWKYLFPSNLEEFKRPVLEFDGICSAIEILERAFALEAEGRKEGLRYAR